MIRNKNGTKFFKSLIIWIKQNHCQRHKNKIMCKIGKCLFLLFIFSPWVPPNWCLWKQNPVRISAANHFWSHNIARMFVLTTKFGEQMQWRTMQTEPVSYRVCLGVGRNRQLSCNMKFFQNSVLPRFLPWNINYYQCWNFLLIDNVKKTRNSKLFGYSIEVN